MITEQQVKEITDDGVFDADEALKVRTLVIDDDGVVDKDEMERVQEIVDGIDQTEAIKIEEVRNLYADCLKNRFLLDEGSPGTIDEDEKTEITDLMLGDGSVGPLEAYGLGYLYHEHEEPKPEWLKAHAGAYPYTPAE